MTALDQLVRADDTALTVLGLDDLSREPRAAKFDNRPTWDNATKKFDNRPTSDNWSKKLSTGNGRVSSTTARPRPF